MNNFCSNVIAVLVLFVATQVSCYIRNGARLTKEFEPSFPIWSTLSGSPTKFYAHQGEKVLVPPHTLASYEIAAINGADYIEPDLVLTKDGILVCYHDVTLKGGTDVGSHPEFEHLKRNFTGVIGIINQTIVDDWFVKDFTLEELRTIFVVQKNEGIRPQYFNEQFMIPTFEEFLEVVHRMSFELNRTIGIIPELKHPSFFNPNWFPNYMEDQFLSTLSKHGYSLNSDSKIRRNNLCTAIVDKAIEIIQCPPVIIQNFDKNALEYISTKTNLPLMMIVHPELKLLTYKGIEELAKFVKYYCVHKEYLYVGVEAQARYDGYGWDEKEIEELGGFIAAQDFVPEAHRLGLQMAVFTINDSREDSRRGCAVRPECEDGDKTAELYFYFNQGLDGIFIENLAESREIRIWYEVERVINETMFSRYGI